MKSQVAPRRFTASRAFSPALRAIMETHLQFCINAECIVPLCHCIDLPIQALSSCSCSLRFVHTIDFQQMVLAAHNNVSRELVQRFFVASKHGATITAPRASAILASPSTGHRIDNASTFAPDIMPVAAMRSQELASQFFCIS